MSEQMQFTVSSLFRFNNHIVLITGGSSGLGEIAAQAFVENGARVIIASRKEQELKKTTDRLNGIGPGSCEYIVADLKNKQGCTNLVKEVKRLTSRLTVLVNNSGATWGGLYDDFPESGWDKVMALNVKAIFYTTAGLEPLLRNGATKESPTFIINVASMAGIRTTDVTVQESGGLAAAGSGTFSYGPSKAACIHLSRLQAAKLASSNINVNCICPGVFPSRMTQFGLDTAMKTLVRKQPTGRIGRPSDFAGLVLFLSSVGAAHLVGGVFELDGGSTRSGFQSPNDDPESKI